MHDLEKGSDAVISYIDKCNRIDSFSSTESGSSSVTLGPEQQNGEVEPVRGVLGNYLEALGAISAPPPDIEVRSKVEKRRYTSESFHNLPNPMPVLKGGCRPAQYLLIQIILFPFVIFGTLVTISGNILIIQTVVWIFLRAFGIRLWDVKEPWSLEIRWPQQIWVSLFPGTLQIP